MMKKNPMVIRDSAVRKYQHNDFKGAIEEYSKLVGTSDVDGRDMYNLGVCYFKEEQFLDAERCYKKAMSLGHVHNNVCHNLGVVSLKLNNYKRAFTYFKAALALDEKDADTIKAINLLEKHFGILRGRGKKSKEISFKKDVVHVVQYRKGTGFEVYGIVSDHSGVAETLLEAVECKRKTKKFYDIKERLLEEYKTDKFVLIGFKK